MRKAEGRNLSGSSSRSAALSPRSATPSRVPPSPAHPYLVQQCLVVAVPPRAGGAGPHGRGDSGVPGPGRAAPAAPRAAPVPLSTAGSARPGSAPQRPPGAAAPGPPRPRRTVPLGARRRHSQGSPPGGGGGQRGEAGPARGRGGGGSAPPPAEPAGLPAQPRVPPQLPSPPLCTAIEPPRLGRARGSLPSPPGMAGLLSAAGGTHGARPAPAERFSVLAPMGAELSTEPGPLPCSSPDSQQARWRLRSLLLAPRLPRLTPRHRPQSPGRMEHRAG